MSNRDMGGPAFPAPYEFVTQQDMGNIFCSEGMTLWDYFAAAALEGLLAADTEANLSMENAAKHASHAASAMLTYRAKRQGGGDG